MITPGHTRYRWRTPTETCRGSVRSRRRTRRPAGKAQGLAFEFWKGRVVILGEGGMATTQVNARVPYGMNQPDNDNKQFILNLMHWLSRKI